MLGTDLGNAKPKVSTKVKNGKVWDFNIENQGKEEAINVDKERQDNEENTEYTTRFGEKIAEVAPD